MKSKGDPVMKPGIPFHALHFYELWKSLTVDKKLTAIRIARQYSGLI
jgi:hypothetical protein